MKRPSVCLSDSSVCLSHWSTAATAAGGFATGRTTGRSIVSAGDQQLSTLAATHPHNNNKTPKQSEDMPIVTITPKVLEQNKVSFTDTGKAVYLLH